MIRNLLSPERNEVEELTRQKYAKEIAALEFLDFSVSFGRPPIPPLGAYVDKPRLLAELKRNHIVQSAPYHVLSKTYDAAYGNQLLIEELSCGTPEMIPTWVVIPDEEAMNCPPAVYLEQVKVNGVRAIRLFPSSTGNPAVATRYAFAHWFYGDYFAEFQRQGIPLVLEFSPNRRDEPDWPKLYGVAKEFPNLNIVLSDGFQRTTWTLLKLLRECPNLYVQTSGLDVHRQVEYIARHIGADRILAGSKFPVSSFGMMIGQVLFSNLSFEEKKQIAGENARRLMGLSAHKGGC